MLYYSTITKKNYETEKECLEAEAAAKKAKTERQKDAENVNKLQKKYLEASDAYYQGVKEFINKYGSYKTTYERKHLPLLRSSVLDDLFNFDFFKNF